VGGHKESMKEVNIVYYILMYKSGKMSPVKTILGSGEGGLKKNDAGGEFN
jgi:hypothetical protein